jgi:Raf kinase inhibitor-like YbhB/YbcL family protein
LALITGNWKLFSEEKVMNIQITSNAFQDGESIPIKYTCDGNDRSPAMSWSGIPEDAQTLALVCEDMDAPSGTFVHWIIYNISPTVIGLAEGVPTVEILPDSAIQGRNDFKRTGYGGPCPPPSDSAHRYFFRLYALDTAIQLSAGAGREEFARAIDGHILAEGHLMGIYQRKQGQTRGA